jgi:hypothetical protein
MPMALSDRAEDNLRFIRDTMAHAGPFTSVSGSGMIVVGLIGATAAIVAPPAIIATNPRAFLAAWLAAAMVAGGVSWFAIRRKAARAGQTLLDGPSRRFALAFAPGLVAGAVLTLAAVAGGQTAFLPGIWLTLYGAAVTAGGALSVRPVPVMGASFIALGAACFFTPPALQPFVLAAGFGGLHLAFGYHITRHYGG